MIKLVGWSKVAAQETAHIPLLPIFGQFDGSCWKACRNATILIGWREAREPLKGANFPWQTIVFSQPASAGATIRIRRRKAFPHILLAKKQRRHIFRPSKRSRIGGRTAC
ncbi:hypothetical protein [Paracoccus beibuensis]|uniref:hypothetical protein n=1 Tax=Paracoccus beibuensis TaxID=547602 RepID=UPI00223FC70D|nr:hypothetical protein [Paracoccus beibuensis]